MQQYGIELSIPTKLTLESEVSILWYRYCPSLENSTEIPITSEELRAYFKSLLDGPEKNGNSNSTLQVETDEMLDQPIVD